MMRSCLLTLILLALVAANGYAIWEIHAIRTMVEEMRAETRLAAESDEVSMVEYARDAAEAVGRGEVERAATDLRRVQELLTETKEAADEQRVRLLEQVKVAQEAVARGSSRAREEIERLAEMMPKEGGRQNGRSM